MKTLTAILIGLLCGSLCLLSDIGMQELYCKAKECMPVVGYIVLDAFTPITWWTSWIIGALVALIWGVGRHNFSTACYVAIAVVTLLLTLVSLITYYYSVLLLVPMVESRDVTPYRIGVNVLMVIGLSIACYRSLRAYRTETDNSADKQAPTTPTSTTLP